MRHETTDQALEWLSARSIPLVALETAPEALDLRTFPWPQPVAVVLGHEVLGVDPGILRRADVLLRIPMFGVKNSLNVASAFAVVAYDLVGKLQSPAPKG
jgi:tRNA G18 (ribose-2'-O)-methylase SpoU